MQTIFGSHSAIPPFRLLRPTRPEDAAAARAEAGPDTWFMAGGVDLVPAMRAGRKAATLISLSEIASMRVIERRGARLRIGAGCSYGAIAADRNVADALPDLAGALGGVANVRVRHAASIGGNIMARQANYDALTALIALDATLIFVRPSGERLSISAGAEMPDALLEAVEIPLSTRSQFAFERGFKPIVSVAVALEFAD
ncbi:MAG: xanthine dehydrogenase family protein subunit M, partial [Alphaproteobacteria bacterium]